MRTVSSFFLLLLTCLVLLGSAQISSASISVSVQSPANGASVGSPVSFTASASSPNGISGWVIYVDNQNRYQVDNNSTSLSATVSLGAGSHSVYIRAWDPVGAYGTSSTFSINVGGSSQSSGGAGKPYSVNQTYYGSHAGWAGVVGEQWQLDLGGNGVDAHEWVENVKLTMW